MRTVLSLWIIAGAASMCVAQEARLEYPGALSVQDAASRTVTAPIAYAVFRSSAGLDSFIVATMNTYHIPGLSACIIRDGEIIWTGSYGYANIERNLKVTNSTLFSIASCSKPVTATALMQLWESGRFGLDEDINRYLPFQVRSPLYPNDSITFRMLLTHTSSIDDSWPMLTPLITEGADSPIRLDSFVVRYLVPGGAYWNSTNYGTWRPSTAYHYSNVGATLLGYLVETITNTPFDRYCRDSLFVPLGMNETSWFLSELDTNHVAMPTYYSGGSFHSYGHYGVPYYPGSQLRTSASQLARFLIAFMQMGEIDGFRVLDSSTVALMTTVQFPALSSITGLVWLIMPYTIPGLGAHILCGHDGASYGVNTEMDYMFGTNKHIGVVVLTNGESGPGRNLVSDALYRFGDTLATGVADESGSLPKQFVLLQNYPNPFNPSTTIKFELPKSSDVRLSVYDMLGRVVSVLVNERKQVGSYEVKFDGSNLASGVYFYRIQAGDFTQAKRLLLLK